MLMYDGKGIPIVMPPEDTDALADWMEAVYPDEFCASLSFEPDFVDALCDSGFIAMATSDGSGGEYLIPKMHILRSVMDPREARVTRTARRESSRYSFGMDERFDEVVEACLRTHDDSWLRPPLLDCWRELHRSRGTRRSVFCSMELYEDGELAAGEIGVFAGACYTSLTGFRVRPGAGTVQLAATARYLAAAGIGLWDLGMPLDYKAGLGARNVSRAAFIEMFREARGRKPRLEGGRLSARELIDSSPT
jgi:leucyl/phenylalanyl-tRNA---protein transferase